MNDTSLKEPVKPARVQAIAPVSTKAATVLKEHIVEVISDSGEGAQRCGQTLGSIAAKMGNGIWTVEIIPAEIRPPARSVAGASGNRIRIGAGPISNGGDATNLVVAFNEQVLLGRVRAGELSSDCIILLESMWREDRDATIAASYIRTHDELVKAGYRVHEIPMERECLTLVSDAKRGKNMFALGMLCSIYSLDLQLAREQIALTVCPLSNLRLRVVNDLAKHPLRRMMDKGLRVTVNSDDPAYFGGYVNENYRAVSEALGLKRDEIVAIVRNGIHASLLSASEKDKALAEVDRVLATIA